MESDFKCEECGKQAEELHAENDFKHDLIWLCEECNERNKDIHGK